MCKVIYKVQIDLFKPSGKWYETVYLDTEHQFLNDAFEAEVRKISLGMTAVVSDVEPSDGFHKHIFKNF